MATATYKHEGARVDYTPGSDVSAGDVKVLTTMIGIATQDIAQDDKGSLAVEGVFSMPKASGSGDENIVQGATVYWDSVNTEVVETSSGSDVYYLGKCAADAAASDETVDVLINVNE